MVEEENKKVESEATQAVEAPSPQEAPADAKDHNDAASEKSLAPIPEERNSDSKSLATIQKFSDSADEMKSGNAVDRDALLARVVTEKRLALIKAWEESEKTKAENKAYKKLSAIGAWENSRKAIVEAQLKKIEEKLEKKRAEYAEKMNNKKSEIHKAAEEKRVMVEAKRGEDILTVEDIAAKFRSTGNTPKRIFGCFRF
ncbi:hypothetical protein HYC85_024630 [Camellia sinensis]|uniref:Remorin C-terminal domain-containing protein n=1 Tax=Camellia sinensis TaxID=4442 RepID=A0A7J7GCK3_CAMSI|nr:hypothetical protein HYC85_024630 [Camellia sinensis]